MAETPKTFDWVRARSACSLKAAFEVLGEVVARDVKSANEVNRPGASFEFSNTTDGRFLVERTLDVGGAADSASVLFELRSNVIVATLPGKGKTLFYVKPVLDVTGECLFEIEGDLELKRPWQVSRKALEDLFFGF